MNVKLWVSLLVAFTCLTRQLDAGPTEAWTGRWLPERTTESGGPSKQPQVDIVERKHGVQMGISSRQCDDAKTNLTVDWDNSPINYTCYTARFVPERNTKALIEYENIPKFYSALHSCMNETITYKEAIPTFGTHRPLWPRYGEYRFVPVQRWMHNLEHGAIVMLFHPCANPALVGRLRCIVRGCLRRHVITPYTLLSRHRPLALVAWGVRLSMSTVDEELVTDFVRQSALRGPEQAPRDGQFDTGLIAPARNVSDFLDSRLCPPAQRNAKANANANAN